MKMDSSKRMTITIMDMVKMIKEVVIKIEIVKEAEVDIEGGEDIEAEAGGEVEVEAGVEEVGVAEVEAERVNVVRA